jgi:hypothetical protein
MPRSIFSRASTENLKSLALTVFFPHKKLALTNTAQGPLRQSSDGISTIAIYYRSSNKSYNDLILFRECLLREHTSATSNSGDVHLS